jgi:hypothetical protein
MDETTYVSPGRTEPWANAECNAVNTPAEPVLPRRSTVIGARERDTPSLSSAAVMMFRFAWWRKKCVTSSTDSPASSTARKMLSGRLRVAVFQTARPSILR